MAADQAKNRNTTLSSTLLLYQDGGKDRQQLYKAK